MALRGGQGVSRASLLLWGSVSLVAAIVLALLLLALQFGASTGSSSSRRGSGAGVAPDKAGASSSSLPAHQKSSGSLEGVGASRRGLGCWWCEGVEQVPRPVLSWYINFVSGALYLPLLNLLSLQFLAAATSHRPLPAALALACLAFLVPFCLFVSQARQTYRQTTRQHTPAGRQHQPQSRSPSSLTPSCCLSWLVPFH